MIEPTAYQIHLLDQALPEAVEDVDSWVEDRTIRGWLADLGMASAARKLTLELAENMPADGCAAAAALATLRRIEERAERRKYRDALQDIEATCQCVKPECPATVARVALTGGA